MSGDLMSTESNHPGSAEAPSASRAEASDPDAFRATALAIEAEVAKVIVGQRDAVRGVLICLIAGGHALLEGVPGVGKTSVARAFAAALGLSNNRVQFTPDLLPADVTGTTVLSGDPATGLRGRFEPGPIFTNLLLADEINRASPRTQSALLEAMQERTVTSPARRTRCRIRSRCSPPKTRSRCRGPIRCPKRSSTASC